LIKYSLNENQFLMNQSSSKQKFGGEKQIFVFIDASNIKNTARELKQLFGYTFLPLENIRHHVEFKK